MDEHSLIAECKRGNSLARKKLYELYAPSMLSVCIRYVNNKETARDLLQDGFIKVFTKIDTYTGSGAFGAWIRRIFVTTALEHLRQKDALRDSIDINEYNDWNGNDDASVLARLSADDLMACIARLPNGFRTVFNMFAIEGYSHAEIAEMLNIKESTSRSQFVRARRILQKEVQLLLADERAE